MALASLDARQRGEPEPVAEPVEECCDASLHSLFDRLLPSSLAPAKAGVQGSKGFD
jgi:hypothetical protein